MRPEERVAVELLTIVAVTLGTVIVTCWLDFAPFANL